MAINKDKGFRASILFNGDMSVGINSRVYHMELDDQLQASFMEDKAIREEFRAKIKALYDDMDNDELCMVAFSDETETFD